MSADWRNVGQGASRVILPAIVTAIAGAAARSIRRFLARREQQRMLAENVNNIRNVVAPASPDQDDLGTRVSKIQEGLSVQTAILEERDKRLEAVEHGQIRLNTRMDRMQNEAATRHTELCTLINSVLRSK